MVLLKVCTYHVDNGKGHVYILRTVENVAVRLAKVNKWHFGHSWQMQYICPAAHIPDVLFV